MRMDERQFIQPLFYGLVVSHDFTKSISRNRQAKIIMTYRYVRLVIFPNSSGISPDKRFTRTELHRKPGIIAKVKRRRMYLS